MEYLFLVYTKLTEGQGFMVQIVLSPAVIAWLNLLLLNIVGALSWYLYILSAMPAHRAEKHGEKAWEDAKRFRAVSGILLFVIVVQMILWLWFPIPGLTVPVHPNPLVPVIIGILIAIPLTAILVKGVMDAGRETMEPSKETRMYGGIYNYIRHPQMVGELPWFVILALFLNSLFLVVYAIVFIGISFPIIVYYEEKDLVKRFGEPYRDYQQRTGAIIPKFWKRRKDQAQTL